MWRYGGIPTVTEAERQGQATADMPDEGKECQEDDLYRLADRPNNMVEEQSDRPTVC